MSLIKQHLHKLEEEEQQQLWEELKLFLEESQELFQQLAHPTPEEVIGYEE